MHRLNALERQQIHHFSIVIRQIDFGHALGKSQTWSCTVLDKAPSHRAMWLGHSPLRIIFKTEVLSADGIPASPTSQLISSVTYHQVRESLPQCPFVIYDQSLKKNSVLWLSCAMFTVQSSEEDSQMRATRHDESYIRDVYQAWLAHSLTPPLGPLMEHAAYHPTATGPALEVFDGQSISSWSDEGFAPYAFYHDTSIAVPTPFPSSYSPLSTQIQSSCDLNVDDAIRLYQAPNLQAQPTQTTVPHLFLTSVGARQVGSKSNIIAHTSESHASSPTFTHWEPYGAAESNVDSYGKSSSRDFQGKRNDLQSIFGDVPACRQLKISLHGELQRPDSVDDNLPAQPLDLTKSIAPLDPDDPRWTLSYELYEWVFAVLYPKRRANKEKNAPFGQCWFCSSVSKHAGSLQQHVTILHRQRLARRFRAGREFNGLLSLTFVVAQIESELMGLKPWENRDATSDEFHRFKDLLAAGPLSNATLHMGGFPMLTSKLEEFCFRESWIGVSCPGCGTWATRRVALKEHATVCAAARASPDRPGSSESSQPASGSGPPVEPELRLTISGRAARPSRGLPRRTHRRNGKAISDV